MSDTAARAPRPEALFDVLARSDPEIVRDLLQAVRSFTTLEANNLVRDRHAGRDVTARLQRIERLNAIRDALERDVGQRQ
jgi:hypothetical protein